MSTVPDNEPLNYKIVTNPTRNETYRVTHNLGRGAFGFCHVLRTDRGKMYAGKFLSLNRFRTNGYLQSVTLNEISIHSGLSHSYVVGFVEAFEFGEHLVCVLEYCPFGNLKELVERRKTLTGVEARYYISHVLKGLEYIHGIDIVHGDLKPANLFISRSMRLKIGDFGLSKRLSGGDGCGEGSLHGTPNYMPPEILEGEGRWSREADLWAAGSTLYCMLVGNPPFQSPTLEQTIRLILDCSYSKHEAGISRQTAIFIDKLLRKEPALRSPASTLLTDPYFTRNFVPTQLPITALYEPPDMKELGKKYKPRKLLKERRANVEFPPESDETSTITR